MTNEVVISLSGPLTVILCVLVAAVVYRQVAAGVDHMLLVAERTHRLRRRRERYRVMVTDPGESKIDTVKAIRLHTELGLKEAIEASQGGRPVAALLSREEAEDLAAALRAVSASAKVFRDTSEEV